jgi:hypothetical protein
VVVGQANDASSTQRAFTFAYGVSANGLVAVGNVMPSTQVTEAFRWTQATGIMGLRPRDA